MPSFDLTTNVKEVPADFHKETTDLIAKLLGKPNFVVGVNVNAGARLTFGGTDEPAGIVHLYSAGCLGPEENNSYTKAIAEHIQKHFNIPSNRSLIFFHDIARTHCSFNGKTLAS
ncbi:hypothetical protein ACROYT_G010808 [Oculina patagonica]